MDFEDQVDWEEIDANRAEAIAEGEAEIAAELANQTCGFVDETEDGRPLGPCQRPEGHDGNHAEVIPDDDLDPTRCFHRVADVAAAQLAAFREYAERAAA